MAAPHPLQHLRRYVIVGLLLALILTLGGAKELIEPVMVEGTAAPVRVTIASGSTGGDIAQLLAAEGLIKSEFFFNLLIRWQGVAGELQAGEYELCPTMSPREIIRQLLEGNIVQDQVPVTIPEGYTVLQMAKLLDQKGFDGERFLTLVQNGNFAYEFLPDLEEGADYRLEGYLFPDTYYFSPTEGEEAIINRMLQRFEEITIPEIQERAEELGMSLHQLVTLASIIEREALLAEEKPVISGVFHKRLQKGMKLQSCATIQYILGEAKANLSTADTQIPSPYNTYIHVGLPPGPIGAPGEDSLLSAANPEENKYFYFCAKDDGSHAFSSTLSEHNQAKRQYRK
ncbi:MAG: endolytic transglycosylase MltG [Firmicutes bacterium]|nr:endolytic transglycosylase MltG [Bacillota bacterium]